MDDRARILVVDDEPQLIRVLRTGLKSRGYDVRGASDGESGFESFNEWHPDLVITDLSMPGMSGIEVCKAIRRTSDVPIIVLSAVSKPAYVDEAMDAGATDYWLKTSLRVDDLQSRLAAYLPNGTGWAEPPRESAIHVR